MIVRFYLNILFVVCLLVGIFLATKCSGGENTSYESVISFYEQEREQLIKDKDILAHQVVTMNQNLVATTEQIKSISKEFSDYKLIQSVTKAEILSKIKDIEVGYITVDNPILVSDSGCIPGHIVNSNFIQRPSKVSFTDKWVSFDATVGKVFKLDSMSMVNKFDVVIGEKVVGKKLLVFNKIEPVVELKSYNPYSEVPYVNNVVLAGEKKRYGRKLGGLATMFAIGFITNQITR